MKEGRELFYLTYWNYLIYTIAKREGQRERPILDNLKRLLWIRKLPGDSQFNITAINTTSSSISIEVIRHQLGTKGSSPPRF